MTTIVRLTKNTHPYKLGSKTLHEFVVDSLVDSPTNIMVRIRGLVCNLTNAMGIKFDFVDLDFDGKDHFINIRMFHDFTRGEAEKMVTALVEVLGETYELSPIQAAS